MYFPVRPRPEAESDAEPATQPAGWWSAFLGGIVGVAFSFILMASWGSKYGAAGGGDGGAVLDVFPCCCGLPLGALGFVVGGAIGSWMSGKSRP